MAEAKKEAAGNAAKAVTVQKKTKQIPAESFYTVSELLEASEQVFGVKRECVTAALAKAKKSNGKLSIAEAKKMVMEFLKREVK